MPRALWSIPKERSSRDDFRANDAGWTTPPRVVQRRAGAITCRADGPSGDPLASLIGAIDAVATAETLRPSSTPC